jgi:hypothetical protein
MLEKVDIIKSLGVTFDFKLITDWDVYEKNNDDDAYRLSDLNERKFRNTPMFRIIT